MFNDASSDFDVLVASDAIGMGLNLNISRIIFSTMEKFDGEEIRDLTISEIKQIAGMRLLASFFGLSGYSPTKSIKNNEKTCRKSWEIRFKIPCWRSDLLA